MRRKPLTPETTYTAGPVTLLPVGSEERDRRTIMWLASVWQSQEYTLREWDKVLQRVEEEEVFKRYPKDNPAGSLESLIKNVIGVSIQESKLRIEERTKSLADVAKPAMKHGGDRKSEDRNQGDNYNLDKHRGTSSSYLASVIARDHPEIHEGMKDGKFKSTRQAAIAAGIIKPSQTWTAPTDVEKLAVAIKKRFTPKEIQSIGQALGFQNESYGHETYCLDMDAIMDTLLSIDLLVEEHPQEWESLNGHLIDNINHSLKHALYLHMKLSENLPDTSIDEELARFDEEHPCYWTRLYEKTRGANG